MCAGDAAVPKQEPGSAVGSSGAAGGSGGSSGGTNAAGGDGSQPADHHRDSSDKAETLKPKPETVWDAKAGKRVPVAAPGGGIAPTKVGSVGNGKAAADSGSAAAAAAYAEQKKQTARGASQISSSGSTAARGKSGKTVWDPKQGRRVPVDAVQ